MKRSGVTKGGVGGTEIIGGISEKAKKTMGEKRKSRKKRRKDNNLAGEISPFSSYIMFTCNFKLNLTHFWLYILHIQRSTCFLWSRKFSPVCFNTLSKESR